MRHAADHSRYLGVARALSSAGTPGVVHASRRPVEQLPLWHVLPGVRALVAVLGEARDEAPAAPRGAWSIEALPSLARSGGCPLVALSATSPRPLLLEALRVVRAAGLLAVVRADESLDAETCQQIAPCVDAVALEFAPFDERSAAGRERACQVRDRLLQLRRADVWVEVATAVERPLPAAAWLETALSLRAIDPAIPWHVIERSAQPAVAAREVAQAQAAGQRAGLHHVYAEAAADGGGELTFCAVCRDVVLIERFMGRPSSFLAAGASCPCCRTRPAGLFEPAAIA